MLRRIFKNKKTGQLHITVPKNNNEGINGDDWVNVTKADNRCQQCGKKKQHTFPYCDRCYVP